MKTVPALRVNAVNRPPIARAGYVLYWMIATRRTRWSFGLQHAINRASQLGLPLIVLEALRVGYPWASPRLHRFVMDGMGDNLARFAGTPIAYHPYLEPTAGHGSGLIEAYAVAAALVVTDEFPCFFLPRMVQAVGKKLDDLGVRLEQVDSNGIMPLRATDRTFTAAQHFRRFMQKEVARHLTSEAFPEADPLAFAATLPRATIPSSILARWPAADASILSGNATSFLASLPLDHEVPVVDYRGGQVAADRVAASFMAHKLTRYGDDRNQPEQDVPSGLSPYLHFGHISVHDIVTRLFTRDQWTLERLAPKVTGSREGWWNLSPEGESFIDELVTWREIGYNYCLLQPGYDTFETLPEWAQATLDKHIADDRPYTYTRAELEQGRTHDALWNAAQHQLRQEGRIHNYLRMLWGKKILEWSETPREALATLIELNNRWSTDGRNPNSYSGIFWTLGRFDRAWGPERPIFGSIRYMSSDNTARKVRVNDYIRRYSGRLPTL